MRASDEHMPDEARLKGLLVGKSITRVEISEGDDPTGKLILSDSTVLTVWGNDGGCACSAGCYPLTRLDGCENVITNVKIEADPAGDDETGEGFYRIFVWAEEEWINIASFDGSDGNGYYGTGWWLRVGPTDPGPPHDLEAKT